MSSIFNRLRNGCVGCGRELASIAIGNSPNKPDETYGNKCWLDNSKWNNRPNHYHLKKGKTCRYCK